MKKYSVFLFIISLVFSACGQRSTNTEVASRPSPEYAANSNAMMSSNSSMSNSSMMSVELRRNDNFDQTSGERYAEIDENPFLETVRAPLSTFSVDVDTAAYSNVRRFLNDGQMPPKDAVRIEEMINYFEYDYPQPIGNLPFSVNTEVATCAWNAKNKIVSIALQGKKVSLEDAPPSNLVFLVDVSGSMNKPDRLPLVKQGLKFLARQLSSRDRVAIVVYAGKSGLVLPSTSDERKILDALENFEAGGSTNGGEGIQLAYKVALDNFMPNGNNRVVLATDGDFNVGLQSDDELVRLIEVKRQSGIFLSVLGFGAGNTNDSMMENSPTKATEITLISIRKPKRKRLWANRRRGHF